MKFVLTGSIGNISKPVTEQLIAAGNDVTVISSNSENEEKIRNTGAKAAIGSVLDAAFLTSAFRGADAVYLMIPNTFTASDFYAYQTEVADNYVNAVIVSGVKNVVLLSSIGAHLRKGAGPIDGLGYLEEKLEKLTQVNLKIFRPAYFYYNLHNMAGMIKQAGIMGANFGGTDKKFPLTHTNDIAKKVAQALNTLNFKGHSIEYIISDERPASEIALVIGEAIGRPGIPWVLFSDEDAKNGMLQSGLSEDMTQKYVEMGKAFREGKAQEHYETQKVQLGETKLEDFAQQFAAAYANA